MNIVFLTHSSDQGHRFRVEQYFPFLTEQGIKPQWQPLPGVLKERLSIYQTIDRFDIICIQRRLLSPFEFSWIRRKSKRIIFDLDDAIMYRSSSSPHPHSFSRWFKFRWMVRGSDVVIAGNRFLKDQVLKADGQKRVYVIPTAIDMDSYPKKKEISSESVIVLGWIGTKGNLRYLQRLEPVFESLSRRFSHLRLKVVSEGRFESAHLPVINKAWKFEEENEDLISFDIGLMPLSDDLWSKGKCGLKIVQYLSVGIPVVCTPVGVNGDIVTDGENGFWATSNQEWVDRLSTLIQDQELRKRMGRKGIEVIEREYSVSVTAGKFYDILRSLQGERA